MCHISLPVVVPGGCEAVDDLTICDSHGRVRDIGWNDVNGAGSHQVFFAADDHFQLTFHDIGDLFVNVMVFGRYPTLLYLPENEGGTVSVYHSTVETRERVLNGDIVEVLHAYFSSKVTRNVDKWISFDSLGGGKIVHLLQIL